MTPGHLAVHISLMVCALATAQPGVNQDVAVNLPIHNSRSTKALVSDLPSRCLYDGRWYAQGAIVPSRDVCLKCSCFQGTLACRRRSCSPLPDPPLLKCDVVHKQGSCCAELHCPDGVKTMENNVAARLDDDLSDIASPVSIAHSCVEGGTMYAAGSAISSSTACEQCFCLGAVRKCIRPQCLPPPKGCVPRPTHGACCPQRYYCEHVSTKPPDENPNDCEVNGKWFSEGERVKISETSKNCTQCFCLRGIVRCQPLACAPPLMGCKPLLRPGECCAQQYHCPHKQGTFFPQFKPIGKTLISTSIKKRSNNLHKQETTTEDILHKNTFTSSISNGDLVVTTKVKRKTNDPPNNSSQKPINVTTTQKPTTIKLASEKSTTEVTTEKNIEQPEETLKIMINGTINCTTQISSATIPVNQTLNDTNMIKIDVQPRIPIINTYNLDDHTFSSNDIITDRNVNGFDENETFTINVTSSLTTNTSQSTKPPMVTVSKTALPTDLVDALNASKKTKGDYDYDYTEPTLPPSLPNLKIIPFVAADAVVDKESPKETLTYPLLERENKFPVYFPNTDIKETEHATKRKDSYNPTKYPIFVSNKESQYPSLTNAPNLPVQEFPGNHDDLDYKAASSLGNRIPEATKIVTKSPEALAATLDAEIPSVNLFSPPIETEGGFVPKSPGIIDDYYAGYPSTPLATAAIPHLTTSMQLDRECMSNDGRPVAEGESVTFACSECTCAWGQLRCTPRSCQTSKDCKQRPASSNAADLCCGELICDEDHKSTFPKKLKNDTSVKLKDISLTIKVDTPPMRKSSNSSLVANKTLVENNTQKTLTKDIGGSIITDNEITTPLSIETSKTNKPQPVNVSTSTTPELNYDTQNSSPEYEDDDEDEGFSLGNVLKLLLSDNYETTSSAIKKTPTTKLPLKATYESTTRFPLNQSIKPFIPLPQRPYIPSNNIQSSVSRIDHLVLGEATAIHNTPRPAVNLISTTTQKISTKPLEITKKEELSGQHTSVTHEGSRPPSLGGIGAGILKLAGCNIYGRMYRVGRIIAELSTPCQECWCTEYGVQCKPLKC